MPFRWTLDKHIKRKNKELGLELTQGQIAHSVKLSRYMVSMMINGKQFNSVRADVVERLMEFFDCSEDELYELVKEVEVP